MLDGVSREGGEGIGMTPPADVGEHPGGAGDTAPEHGQRDQRPPRDRPATAGGQLGDVVGDRIAEDSGDGA